MASQHPDFKLQIGSVKAAVWHGERGPSIKLTKSYKDQNDQWVDQSMSMFEGDLSILATVLGRLENYLAANSSQATTRARTGAGESDGRRGYSDTPRAPANSPRASAPVDAYPVEDGDVPF